MINNVSKKIAFSALKMIKYGKIIVTDYDDRKYIFGDDESLVVIVKINKSDFFKKIISKGSIGMAEAYMNNEFETDNLSGLIELTAKNIKIIHKFSGILDLSFINYLKKMFNKNTKSNSKKNISKHYDLGNEFFSLWLDNSCGWGGFAEFIGKNYDVKLDCITISKKQFDYAKNRIYKIGLNEKVNIKMQDYRDVENKYNSIASIEMIEAVGQNYLKNYFQSIKKYLKDDGKAAIQAITIDDKLFNRYKKKEDFIQKYIFPGGFLPSKGSLVEYAKKTGLELNQCSSYGVHYSNTLKIWREKFFKSWELISKQGFDNTFKRMWNFYLSYCEAGFRSKNIDLIQFSLLKK